MGAFGRWWDRLGREWLPATPGCIWPCLVGSDPNPGVSGDTSSPPGLARALGRAPQMVPVGPPPGMCFMMGGLSPSVARVYNSPQT